MKNISLLLLVLIFLPVLPVAQTVEDHLRLGKVFASAQEYDQAILQYDAAIHMDPQRVEAYYFRGLLYCQLGEFQQCSADLRRAEMIDPQWLHLLRTQAPADTWDTWDTLPAM